MGMKPEVSYGEVLSLLQERLNSRLKKASIYSELLNACTTTARRIQTLHTLKSKGATLHLVEFHSTNFHIHMLEEKYIPLYQVCRKLDLQAYYGSPDDIGFITPDDW